MRGSGANVPDPLRRRSKENSGPTRAKVEKEYGGATPDLAVVKLPASTTVTEAFVRFNQSANVLYAEPNYKYKLFVVPNDPMFSQLWGFDNTGQSGGTEDADIDAPEAWDISTGSSNVVVGIIDTRFLTPIECHRTTRVPLINS